MKYNKTRGVLLPTSSIKPEVEGIAKAVARECAGLPLEIITVVGSLRGVDDLHECRNILKKLRESEFKNKCSSY